MRILLIAYEFPPSPSPQSLRWAYLARELHLLGAEIQVLSVERGGERVRLDLPPGVLVHRTPAGLVSGYVGLLKARWSKTAQATAPAIGGGTEEAVAPPSPAVAAPKAQLNWKGRLVERLNRVAGRFTFPDAFGQWEPVARWKLRQLLSTCSPHVVVSSHEPSTTLRLGRIAKEAGFPWHADLGDPVLSFYTPRRWQRLAGRIEDWTCRHADHVSVTTEAAKALLCARHDVPESRISVLPQGYDPVEAPPVQTPPVVACDDSRLELVYTGSFYAFRQSRQLVDAVLASQGVRLTIATRKAPDWLPGVAAAHPERVRMAGFLTHGQALALQRSADVLVNIANDDPVQVPGKLFEYLGANKPILHVGTGAQDDAVAALLRAHARGVAVENDSRAIGAVLSRLSDIRRDRAWDREFRLGNDGLEAYQWRHIASRLFDILQRVADADRGKAGRSIDAEGRRHGGARKSDGQHDAPG